MHFNLITWPGYLCICGDCGSFVFRRLNDMFQFFRSHDGKLRVNLSYWAEKAVGVDRSDGLKKYSADKFRAAIAEWLDDMEASQDLRDAVDDDVLRYSDEGEHDAMRAALDFRHDGKHVFQDFWEVSIREWSFYFEWCCYAIAWGVCEYDRHRAG